MKFFIPLKEFCLYSNGIKVNFIVNKLYNINWLTSYDLNHLGTPKEKVKYLVQYGWVKEVMPTNIEDWVKAALLQEKECSTRE